MYMRNPSRHWPHHSYWASQSGIFRNANTALVPKSPSIFIGVSRRTCVRRLEFPHFRAWAMASTVRTGT